MANVVSISATIPLTEPLLPFTLNGATEPQQRTSSQRRNRASLSLFSFLIKLSPSSHSLNGALSTPLPLNRASPSSHSQRRNRDISFPLTVNDGIFFSFVYFF
ncbi:hypothetical protein CFOL_v3_27397 [Cephalotus follicularis]|uniref:Uncharacterized protein n=1 Tax=Cephalotus follicularis TaxID=3775 RepID=A0A1Q3CUU3_CEPFO|nr:hypothetical protein CFOL_v3_27397 [Cephalotus follicularis]